MRPAFFLAILFLAGCSTPATYVVPPEGELPAEEGPSGGGGGGDPATRGDLRGELDPTFTQGPNEALAQVLPHVLEVDHDGRIYVAGPTTACVPNQDVYDVVVRLTPSGALDQTFAKAGRLCMLQRSLHIEAIKAAQDGSTYVGGSRTQDGFAFVDHYDSMGVLDERFGRVGTYASTGNTAWFLHLAVVADGVIAVGQHGNSGLVAKFGADGKLVTTFGTAGIVVARDDSGAYSRPVVIGDQLVVSALGSDDFNGWEVQSFHTMTGAMKRHSQMPLPKLVGQGRVVASVAAPDLALGGSRELFVGGYRQEGNVRDRVAVGRIHETLAPDTTFGQGGTFDSDVFATSTLPNLVATSGGAVIVAGNDRRSGAKYGSAALVRVNKQGQLDTSFGDAGVRRLTDPVASPSSFVRIEEDRTSGNVVVLAQEGAPSSPHFGGGNRALLYRVR